MAPRRQWLVPASAFALSVGASGCQLVGGIGDISLIEASTPDTSDAPDSGSHPRPDAASSGHRDARVDANSTKNPPDAHKDVAAVAESGAGLDVGVDVGADANAGDSGCSPGCAEGSACTTPNDCASGNCASSLCAPPGCAPTCNTGDACEDNGDCSSHSCGAGHQCVAPACSPLCAVGSACADNGNCASEECQSSVCLCAQEGAPCATSADCCNGGACSGNGQCSKSVQLRPRTTPGAPRTELLRAGSIDRDEVRRLVSLTQDRGFARGQDLRAKLEGLFSEAPE